MGEPSWLVAATRGLSANCTRAFGSAATPKLTVIPSVSHDPPCGVNVYGVVVVILPVVGSKSSSLVEPVMGALVGSRAVTLHSLAVAVLVNSKVMLLDTPSWSYTPIDVLSVVPATASEGRLPVIVALWVCEGGET